MLEQSEVQEVIVSQHQERTQFVYGLLAVAASAFHALLAIVTKTLKVRQGTFEVFERLFDVAIVFSSLCYRT